MGVDQIGALLLLSALWGGSFLFMRIAAPALGPILLIELRVLLASLALLTPMGEALTVRKVGGLVMGFVGVTALVGLGPLSLTVTTVWALAASLVAALFYGVAAVYTKVKVQGGEPQGLALYSQLFAALVLMPLVPFALPSAWPSATVIISVLLLALLSTALGYRLYFYLIVHAGPTKATMVTYLAPAFGMLWGALFLHESLAPGFLLGFLLILGSVAFVTGDRRREADGRDKSSTASVRG